MIQDRSIVTLGKAFLEVLFPSNVARKSYNPPRQDGSLTGTSSCRVSRVSGRLGHGRGSGGRSRPESLRLTVVEDIATRR